MLSLFEDSKGVIRSRKVKQDRQYIDQKTKDKRSNNDVHKIHRNLKIGQLNSVASKRIFETIKSAIDAVKFSNTIQLSPF